MDTFNIVKVGESDGGSYWQIMCPDGEPWDEAFESPPTERDLKEVREMYEECMRDQREAERDSVPWYAYDSVDEGGW